MKMIFLTDNDEDVGLNTTRLIVGAFGYRWKFDDGASSSLPRWELGPTGKGHGCLG